MFVVGVLFVISINSCDSGSKLGRFWCAFEDSFFWATLLTVPLVSVVRWAMKRWPNCRWPSEYPLFALVVITSFTVCVLLAYW